MASVAIKRFWLHLPPSWRKELKKWQNGHKDINTNTFHEAINYYIYIYVTLYKWQIIALPFV